MPDLSLCAKQFLSRVKRARFRVLLFIMISHTAYSQPVLESYEATTGESTTAAINRPTDTQENELMVVGLMIEEGSDVTITPPAEWTLILREDNSTYVGMASYYKVAGSSEPSSYSFTLSEDVGWAIGCARISNCNASEPIDASSSMTGNGSSPIAPTLTTSGADRLVLCLYTNAASSSYSPQAGFNQNLRSAKFRCRSTF